MKFPLTAITAAMLLAACSATPQTGKTDFSTRKENKTMSDSKINPKLTPRQLLTRLLTLLEQSKSVDEFTPERLEEAFQVPIFKYEENSYGFGEQVTKMWNHGFSVDENILLKKKQFTLSFNFEDDSIAHPEMTEVCEMKFDEFIDKAETIGFSAKPVYAKGNVFRGGRIIQWQTTDTNPNRRRASVGRTGTRKSMY